MSQQRSFEALPRTEVDNTSTFGMGRPRSVVRQPRSPIVNVFGQTVRWRFTKIIDTHENVEEELSDGVEVFSAFGGSPRIRALWRSAEWWVNPAGHSTFVRRRHERERPSLR
jgi:hypothetical protein